MIVDGKSDMAANDLPNMDRTAEAIREHDRVALRVAEIVGGECSRDEILERLDELKMSEAAVGEAFALDTADRNSADNAKLVTPNGHNGWVRRLLHEAGYEGVAPTEEQRRRSGWGW